MAYIHAATSSDPQTDLARYQRLRRFVLGGLILIIGFGLLSVDSSQTELVHEKIELWGMMAMLIGIGGRLWSTLYIGGRKASQIVDIGPYSVTRNPLYLFSAIASAGIGMQVGSWLLGLMFFVLCWAAFSIVTLREEKFLSQQFGAPYQDYLNRVPRFFPNPMIYRDVEEAVFQPSRLRQTLLDGLFFFAAVPAFELIERAQQSGLLPVLASLP